MEQQLSGAGEKEQTTNRPSHGIREKRTRRSAERFSLAASPRLLRMRVYQTSAAQEKRSRESEEREGGMARRRQSYRRADTNLQDTTYALPRYWRRQPTEIRANDLPRSRKTSMLTKIFPYVGLPLHVRCTKDEASQRKDRSLLR